jgi:hypothetical protein
MNPHKGGHHSSKAVAGADWGAGGEGGLEQVVISTTEVVISSSKDRTQGSQLAQHLPPVGPGSSSGHALQAGLLSLG